MKFRATLSLLLVLCGLVAACSGGSSSSTANSSANRPVTSESAVATTVGSFQRVTVSMQGSDGSAKNVKLSVADPSVAHASIDTCFFSNGNDSQCTVTITGAKFGTTELVADIDGNRTAIPVSVGSASTNSLGTVTVMPGAGSVKKDPTDPKSPRYFAMNSGAGGQAVANYSYNVSFVPSTTGEAQVTGANPIVVMLLSNLPQDTLSNNQTALNNFFCNNPTTCAKAAPPSSALTQYQLGQCNLTAQSPTCTISGFVYPAYFPSGINTQGGQPGVTTTAYVTGTWAAGGQPFNGSNGILGNVNFKNTGLSSGKISVGTQDNTGVIYSGFNAPLFINLEGNTQASASYPVTVSIASSSQSLVSFYYYTPGDNTRTKKTLTQQSCTLTVANTSVSDYQTNSRLSCAYGISALPGSAGQTAQFNITASGTGGPSLPSCPDKSVASCLQVSINDPSNKSANSRTITFTNNSPDTVRVYATQGTATSMTSPVTSGIMTGQNLAHGANSGFTQCSNWNGTNSSGNSDSTSACPIGASCLQGGATVTSGKSGTQFQCFWDAPQVTSGSDQLAPTKSMAYTIPGASGITSGGQQIQWSGNFYTRKCINGNCPPAAAVGTGSSWASLTLGEVTFAHNSVDYYDVSIINGVNYALQFAPNNPGYSPSATSQGKGLNPFSCAAAGWNNAQGQLTQKSSWSFAPSAASLTSAASATDMANASSHFAVVVNDSTDNQACNSSASNPAAGTNNSYCQKSGNVCGWDKASIVNGKIQQTDAKVCGQFFAWTTPDTLSGMGNFFGQNNSPATIKLPANSCDSTFTAPSQSLWNLLKQYTFSTARVSTCSSSPTSQTYVLGMWYQACTNQTVSAFQAQPSGDDNLLVCGGSVFNKYTQLNALNAANNWFTLNTNNGSWISDIKPTIDWLKQGCPTCYVFPFDDMTSTHTCTSQAAGSSAQNQTNYTISIGSITNKMDQ